MRIRLFLMLTFSLIAAATAHAERRVALVIGNSAYQRVVPLPNPTNDAHDVAEALESLGFEVILERDANRAAMEQAIVRFGRVALNADAALFYYAGHGLQRHGSTYIVPVDAKLEDELALNFELTKISDVISALNGARGVRLLILDACRNFPLPERQASARGLSMSRGLARLDAIRGMVIAYATQPDQVAVDGTGRNSPFTSALLEQLAKPGLEIATLFRRIAGEVYRQTNGGQLPEVSISLVGDFYLNTEDTDLAAWAKIRTSTAASDFQRFLSRYPDSPLKTDAQARLLSIESEAGAELQSKDKTQQHDEQIANDDARFKQEQLRRKSAAVERLQTAEREKEHERLSSAQQPGPNPAKQPNQVAVLTAPNEPLSPAGTQTSARAELNRELQLALRRVGCYSGKIDGDWRESSRAGLRNFMKNSGATIDVSEATEDVLKQVAAHKAVVCSHSPRRAELPKPGEHKRTEPPAAAAALQVGCRGGDISECRELCKLTGHPRPCAVARYGLSCRSGDLTACQQVCAAGGQRACNKLDRLTSGRGRMR